MAYTQARCALLMCIIGLLLVNSPWHFLPSFARTANVAATASTPTLTELGRLSGAILSVEVQDDIAVVGDQQGLLLLDVSHSASPIQISRLHLGGTINDLFVRNNLVYAANDQGFLQIVDITNPFAPRLRGQLSVPVSGEALDIVGDRAAIAAHNGGLLIADIHNPDAPALLGASGSVLGSTLDVRYIGNRVYIASLSGLHIFDVNDPTHPTQIGFYNAITNNDANGYAVDVVGTYAYVAVGFAGLLILDVSVPTAPQLLASIDTPGFTMGLHVVGNKAYLAEREGGLQVVDLQDPAQPKLAGALDTAGSVYRLTVVDNLAYLADRSGGLVIADVSQAQPIRKGLYGVGGSSTEMAVVGDRLYISSYEGLSIADISTPNRPHVLGALELPGFAYTLVTSGTTVFLGNDLRKQNANFNDWQVTAVDVSNPAAPQVLSAITFASASVMDLKLIGTTLYVATGNKGLQLVDVANPRAPIQLGAASAVSDTYISSIVMDGNRAYLSTNKVLDVRVPTAPTLVATLNLPDSVVRVASGSTLYAVKTKLISQPFPSTDPPEYLSTLSIVDASSFQTLHVTGIYTLTQGFIEDVKVRNNVAYVATTTGIDLVDVSDMANPTLIASPPLNAFPSTILFASDILFGAGYISGVQLYATTQQYVPSSFSMNSDTQLTSADGSVNLLFSGQDKGLFTSVAHMDRLTISQASNEMRDIERSFLVEARNSMGRSIGQATTPYTVEVAIPASLSAATTHLGIAYWNGTTWVDLPTCNGCGAQPGKLVVQTDRFGELAVMLDAPLQPEQPSPTPSPSPSFTPSPSPTAPPAQNAQHRVLLPAIHR